MMQLAHDTQASDLIRIRLVLMDIDGTLVRGSEMDLGNVMRQLARLKRAGKVDFSFATGRTITGARSVVRALDPRGRIPLIIAYNGGVIARPDANPWMERLPIVRSSFVHVVGVCRRLKLRALAYTCNDRFDLTNEQEKVFSEGAPFPDKETEFNGMPVVHLADLTTLASQDVIAVLVTEPSGASGLEALSAQLQRECGTSLRVTTSGGVYAEIAHRHATKLEAMQRLCVRLGLKPDQVMAIGDNFNDLEMVAGCGFGVAVANSPPALQQASRYVCRQADARGVVEILRQVVDAHRYEHRRRKVAIENN